MYVQGSTEPHLKSLSISRFFKCLVLGILGLSAMAWVLEMPGAHERAAVQSGETDAVVVHVTAPDVEVVVGGRGFLIEGWASEPIVCKLPEGRHDLYVIRNRELLYKETFTVRSGEGVVLTAWTPNQTYDRTPPTPRP